MKDIYFKVKGTVKEINPSTDCHKQLLPQNKNNHRELPALYNIIECIYYQKSTSIWIFNNNFRPVAFTSLMVKAKERVMKKHNIKVTVPLMGPLQFVYHSGRVVDDAGHAADSVDYKLPDQQVTESAGQ